MKILAGSALMLTFAGSLFGMPQDSNTYFYTTQTPSKGKCQYFDYLYLPKSPSLSSSTVSEYQLILYSNPDQNGKINIDNYIHPGSKVARDGVRLDGDRGGDVFIDFNNASVNIVRTNNGCIPAAGGINITSPYVSLFDRPAYSTPSGTRWLKISYNYPGTSVSDVSQPFAIFTKVVPLGKFDWGHATSTAIPLDDFGIEIKRVVYFKSLEQTDGPGVLTPNSLQKSYWDLSQGVSSNYGTQSNEIMVGLQNYLSEATNSFILANGSRTGVDKQRTVNRGYVQIQYVAAQCTDGYGSFSSANVGGRVLAARGDKDPWALNSTYGGCYGNHNGIHVIENTGDDIWGTSDNFRYVYKSGTGNRTLQVRVDQLENTGPWARAGLMIRTGTGATAYNIGVFVTPSNGLIFQRRLSTTAGNSASSGTVAGIKAPIWLQLVYNNATQLTTAWYGSDTSPWIQIGTGVAGAFGSYTYGLAAASRSSVPNTSVYSNLNF